jgi:hypothetical protein
MMLGSKIILAYETIIRKYDIKQEAFHLYSQAQPETFVCLDAFLAQTACSERPLRAAADSC